MFSWLGGWLVNVFVGHLVGWAVVRSVGFLAVLSVRGSGFSDVWTLDTPSEEAQLYRPYLYRPYHTYIGHNYIGHNYIGHDNKGHDNKGHYCVGHNNIGHYRIGHSSFDIGHSFVGPQLRGPQRCPDVGYTVRRSTSHTRTGSSMGGATTTRASPSGHRSFLRTVPTVNAEGAAGTRMPHWQGRRRGCLIWPTSTSSRDPSSFPSACADVFRGETKTRARCTDPSTLFDMRRAIEMARHTYLGQSRWHAITI